MLWCVGQFEEETGLPYGASVVAAPTQVRDFVSSVPLDKPEETVREVVYDIKKPRVRRLCVGRRFCCYDLKLAINMIYYNLFMASAIALLFMEKKAPNRWASLLFRVESLR